MAEVLYPNREKFSSKIAFDNIAIILKLIIIQILSNLVRIRSKG